MRSATQLGGHGGNQRIIANKENLTSDKTMQSKGKKKRAADSKSLCQTFTEENNLGCETPPKITKDLDLSIGSSRLSRKTQLKDLSCNEDIGSQEASRNHTETNKLIREIFGDDDFGDQSSEENAKFSVRQKYLSQFLLSSSRITVNDSILPSTLRSLPPASTPDRRSHISSSTVHFQPGPTEQMDHDSSDLEVWLTPEKETGKVTSPTALGDGQERNPETTSGDGRLTSDKMIASKRQSCLGRPELASSNFKPTSPRLLISVPKSTNSRTGRLLLSKEMATGSESLSRSLSPKGSVPVESETAAEENGEKQQCSPDRRIEPSKAISSARGTAESSVRCAIPEAAFAGLRLSEASRGARSPSTADIVEESSREEHRSRDKRREACVAPSQSQRESASEDDSTPDLLAPRRSSPANKGASQTDRNSDSGPRMPPRGGKRGPFEGGSGSDVAPRKQRRYRVLSESEESIEAIPCDTDNSRTPDISQFLELPPTGCSRERAEVVSVDSSRVLVKVEEPEEPDLSRDSRILVRKVVCVQLKPDIESLLSDFTPDLLQGFCGGGCHRLSKYKYIMWTVGGPRKPVCGRCLKSNAQEPEVLTIDFWFEAKFKLVGEEAVIEVIFTGEYGAKFLGCTKSDYFRDECLRNEAHLRIKKLIKNKTPFDLEYLRVKTRNGHHYRAV